MLAVEELTERSSVGKRFKFKFSQFHSRTGPDDHTFLPKFLFSIKKEIILKLNQSYQSFSPSTQKTAFSLSLYTKVRLTGGQTTTKYLPTCLRNLPVRESRTLTRSSPHSINGAWTLNLPTRVQAATRSTIKGPICHYE